VDKPAFKDNEILIAIHATTVSTGDCNMRNLTFVTRSMLPFAKLMFGIGKPWKPRVLGTELTGEVESAGKDVKKFKKGDRIVASTGMAGGGHAQCACLPETAALALKSDSLSWEEAVAIPFGANTALYFLRDLTKIQAGQEILHRRFWEHRLGRCAAGQALWSDGHGRVQWRERGHGEIAGC
jgi:NADPH:quinone reductase-like Zn-dependent oxidoreductase